MTDDHPHLPDQGAPGAGGETPRSLPVLEEPLDPANQSLADALRQSFRVLKFLMVVVAIIFAFSGFKIVDQNQVVVLSRLGKLSGPPRKPGLLVAMPYPIDEKTVVQMDTRSLEIKTFWMAESAAEATKPLSERYSAKPSLTPMKEGFLVTPVSEAVRADRAGGEAGQEIVHVKWPITYRVVDPLKFVENVLDEKATVQSEFEAACVAMATRFTVDEIAFVNQSAFRVAVQNEAQRRLDAIDSGIQLEKVNSIPYQPLQVRDEFNAVIQAENRKRQTIQQAVQEAERVLNEAAGEAYPKLVEAIRQYERERTGDASPERVAALESRIDELLETVVRGRASEAIKRARADADQIVQELQADAAMVLALKPKLEESPRLLPSRLWQNVKQEILTQSTVSLFYLPRDMNELSIWLNRDPKQERERLRAELRKSSKPPPR
jgi:membrane protease subunit HflK